MRKRTYTIKAQSADSARAIAESMFAGAIETVRFLSPENPELYLIDATIPATYVVEIIGDDDSYPCDHCGETDSLNEVALPLEIGDLGGITIWLCSPCKDRINASKNTSTSDVLYSGMVIPEKDRW